MKVLTLKRYQDHIPCSLVSKVVCVDDRFTKPIVVYRGENSAYELIKAILKEYKYCRKLMNKHLKKFNHERKKKNINFNKVTVVGFIKNLVDNDEEKVRDGCYVTGKFRTAAYWNCNINLHLTKKAPVIFHYLRGYDSHLIFNEIDKFDVKINVIPNGLEKYMTYFLNKNLVFIDSMQFMNSSLDKIVKNLSDEDFKYLVGAYLVLKI